jgi:ParB family chromosome partitioning protein
VSGVEWYTPPEIVDAARAVLGRIDLDPASCAVANKVVRARRFYTKENSGLTPNKRWSGRVFMNPPYSRKLVNQFTDRLVEEYRTGRVTEAVVLLNNITETRCFQNLAAAASAMCLIEKRLSFWGPEAGTSGPERGQALLYLGNNPKRFLAAFASHGCCQKPVHNSSSGTGSVF